MNTAKATFFNKYVKSFGPSDQGYIFVLFDTDSLFTNTQNNHNQESQWKMGSKTFISANNTFKQNDGIRIESYIGLLVANIIMTELKQNFIKT